MKHIPHIFAMVFFGVFVLGTFGLLYRKGITPERFYARISALKLEPLKDFHPAPARAPFSNSNLSLTPNSWQFIPIVVKGSQWGGGVTPGPLVVSSNGRYLEDQAGNPVLLVGDAAWSAIAELTTSEMDTYLEDRANRGFNFVLVNLIEHYFATSAPNNIYGDPPFTGANFTTPNEDYFLVADHFVRKAYSLGIYVLLATTYLGYSGTEEGWDTEIVAASTGDMQTWGEFCGDRYKDFDNIIWVMGADQDPSSYMSKLNAFLTGLQNYDTRHLITADGEYGNLATDQFGSLSQLDVNTSYDYGGISGLIKDGYDYTPTLPVFGFESRYENDGATDQELRAQFYYSVLGGGFGQVFGNTPLWKFAYDGGSWTSALGDNGSVHRGRAAALFNSIDWHTLVPDYSHALLTSGYGTLDNSNYASSGINIGGTLAVIYMPSNRTMTMDMSPFSGTVTARWYDPTSGKYEDDPVSPLYNGGMHNFSHSGKNADGDSDWVLILDAQ